MDKKEFSRKLRKFAIPIAIQSFMLAAVAASDSFMLGFVSEEALSAVSLATKVQFVQNLGLSGIVAGGTVIGSQYLGAKQDNKCRDIFSIVLRYTTLISITFFLLSFLIPTQLMHIFTSDKEMISIGSKYLRIASFSYLLSGISQAYLCMFKIHGKAHISSIISSTAVIANIILNALFIFGIGSFKGFGARGAAVSTVIARGIEIGLIIILNRKAKIHFNPSSLFRVHKGIEKEFWKITRVLLTNEYVWGLGITMYSVFIGHLGVATTAANSVSSVIKDLVTSLCRGIGVGGGILLGYSLGENKLERAKEEGSYLAKKSIMIGVVCGVLVLILSPLISHFMKLSKDAQDLLVWMNIICAFYMISKSINIMCINGIFGSGGDTSFDFYSLVTTMWLDIIPIAAIGTFAFNLPAIVVYIIISLDETIKIPWVFVHFKKYKWLNNITTVTE